jgi:uncharacterized HAD superfamily protein
MVQPLAILDIDDVLSDTTPFMLSELNRRHGTDYRVDDMNAFYLWDAFNIPAQHVVELILSVEFQRGCPPLNGAAEATHRLKAAGYEVWLVTARPLEMHPMTLEWLTEGGFAYDNLVMGLAGSAKTSVFPRRATIACEDRADAAAAFADHADVVYLFSKPWNRDGELPANVRKITSWDEVEINTV